MKLKIFTDGASSGNPGDAGIGYVIKDENDVLLKEGSSYIGIQTNNQAEYVALIAGIENAADFRPDEIIVFLDSELVVRQLTGVYRVKDVKLKGLYQKALQILRTFTKYDIIHIRRELNAEADALAKKASQNNEQRG